MLRTALGPAISDLLRDPSIVEVMLNPDGRIWVDRLAGRTGRNRRKADPEDGAAHRSSRRHHVGAEVHARAPRVSAELPESGERFEGLLPPVVTSPTFAIRKPAVAVFTPTITSPPWIMADAQAACVA
jgi:type IV secretion system protein VirB11